uniref:Triosephosphate isomerase n=1 Tax=Dermatophagoides pteronyssinus TaxID=6956 RepID=A0A6P6XPS7_DERPT|nr:triosephosphate isomerase-like [Dermatophagoides pteronyssinus]
MARKTWIGANWKCNGSFELIKKLSSTYNEHKPGKADVVIFPPALYVFECQKTFQKPYEIGVQSVFSAKCGAYTGDLCPEMLDDFNTQWVLVGHSERRAIHKESNCDIAQQTRALISHNKKVVLCIGENQTQFTNNETKKVLDEQLSKILSNTDISDEKFAEIVIAYEPVWAIGTGISAEPKAISETINYIRASIAKTRSAATAEKIRIVYGGSVNPENCDSFLKEETIDGLLVGGASIKPDFGQIIQAANKA